MLTCRCASCASASSAPAGCCVLRRPCWAAVQRGGAVHLCAAPFERAHHALNNLQRQMGWSKEGRGQYEKRGKGEVN